MINNDGKDVGGLAQLFDQKHRQLTTPPPFPYISGSIAETTDDISDEFDKNFMEEGIMPMLSSFTYKGNIDEQFLNL